MQKINPEIQISIVIPVYNGEKYLSETLRSVLRQSLQNYEILIIDDGSTDNTEMLALSLKADDNRVFYYKKPNSGVSNTRNFGLKRARGEFIIFLDSDDVIDIGFLQSRIDYLTRNPEIGLCCSRIKLIDQDGNLITGDALSGPSDNMLEDILCYTPGIASVPSNFMHRRSVIYNLDNCFDPRLSSTADRFLLCRLAAITKCYCLPFSNLNYRVHAKSMFHNPASVETIFRDNERFMKILLEERMIPRPLLREFLKRNYYMLAGSALRSKAYFRSLVYAIKYILIKVKYIN